MPDWMLILRKSIRAATAQQEGCDEPQDAAWDEYPVIWNRNWNSSWTPGNIFGCTFNFLLYSKAERACVCVCATSCYRRTLWREALRRGRGGTDATCNHFQCKVITRGDESENVIIIIIITGRSPIFDVSFCREISGSCSAALRGINTPRKQKNVCFGATRQMAANVMLIWCRKKLGEFCTISKKKTTKKKGIL